MSSHVHLFVCARCACACVRACVYVFVRSICAGGLLPSWAVLDFAGVVRSGGVPQERHARVGDGALTVAGRGHLQKGPGERTITLSRRRRISRSRFRGPPTVGLYQVSIVLAIFFYHNWAFFKSIKLSI